MTVCLHSFLYDEAVPTHCRVVHGSAQTIEFPRTARDHSLPHPAISCHIKPNPNPTRPTVMQGCHATPSHGSSLNTRCATCAQQRREAEARCMSRKPRDTWRARYKSRRCAYTWKLQRAGHDAPLDDKTPAGAPGTASRAGLAPYLSCVADRVLWHIAPT